MKITARPCNHIYSLTCTVKGISGVQEQLQTDAFLDAITDSTRLNQVPLFWPLSVGLSSVPTNSGVFPLTVYVQEQTSVLSSSDGSVVETELAHQRTELSGCKRRAETVQSLYVDTHSSLLCLTVYIPHTHTLHFNGHFSRWISVSHLTIYPTSQKNVDHLFYDIFIFTTASANLILFNSFTVKFRN